MPRYHITTADGFLAPASEGLDLPDEAALEKLMCRTLARMLEDEGCRTGHGNFMAYAEDENGRRVMTATVTFAVFRA